MQRLPAMVPAANITVFDTEQGLPMSTVISSFCDRQGNVWFGTMGAGVAKFDGRAFQTITTSHGLASNVVMAITEDSKGNMWFATYGGGVTRYDGIAMKTFSKADGLANDVVTDLTEDRAGNLWLATGGSGVSRFNGNSFTTYDVSRGLVDNNVNCIKLLPDGKVWIGTDRGVSVFDGKSFVSPEPLKHIEVTSIVSDAQQNVWVATSRKGLFKVGSNSVRHFTQADGLPDTTIRECYADRAGRIWFASQTQGVFYYDGNAFVPLGTPKELTARSMRTITEDRNGVIWIGTFNQGVWRYNGDAVSTYGTQHGLASDVRGVTQDRAGNLWLSMHYGGIARFDGRNFSLFTRAQGLPSNDFFSVAEDSKGNIWLGGIGDGLIKYDGRVFSNYRIEQGLPHNTVTAIFEDRDGTMWIGTQDGLCKFNGQSFEKTTWSTKLDTRFIRCILQARDGKLWFGAYGGGVASYDGKVFTAYSTEHGLANNDINCMHEDNQGYIWFGGAGGLTRFDGKSFLPIGHSVTDATINAVVEDDDGKLWVGTNHGIHFLEFVTADNVITHPGRFRGSNEDVKRDVRFKWETFNVGTGYPIKDVNPNVMIYLRKSLPMLNDSQGKIWLGCGDGALIRFDSRAVIRNSTPPEIQLKNVQLNETQVAWFSLLDPAKVDSTASAQQQMMYGGVALSAYARDSTRQYYSGIKLDGVEQFSNVPRNLVLPYRFSRITFEFNSIEVSRNPMVKYQYRLEGQHPGWSAATNSNVASFSNLVAGDYKFQARAQGPDGLWSAPLTFEFSVLPPWWRTRTMYFVYLIAALVLIRAFIKWRERGLHREKQLLEQLVGERTLELKEQMLEAERQRALVEVRNKEIRDALEVTERNLSGMALQMIHRYHSYEELEQEVRKLAGSGEFRKEYQKLISMINTDKSLDTEWDHFNQYFNHVHKDFNDKLRQRCDQLTSNDLRMAALIKMGFGNREIAMLLNIETSSVKMAKYRLKKKLQVEEDTDLAAFLAMQ